MQILQKNADVSVLSKNEFDFSLQTISSSIN